VVSQKTHAPRRAKAGIDFEALTAAEAAPFQTNSNRHTPPASPDSSDAFCRL
jgi:hypothetical protein